LQDGQYPVGGLLDVNRALYGTTSRGGSGKCALTSGLIGCGTLYKVNVSSGKKRILYNFQGSNDGYGPDGGLIDVNGPLYGTTHFGGAFGSGWGCGGVSGLEGCGTIFKIRPSGDGYNVVSRFQGPKSDRPNNVLDVNGTLYGTTAYGGTTVGDCFSVDGPLGCGTLFKFDVSSRRLTVLYRFRGGRDGANPTGLGAYINGVLYSTTFAGGTGCHGYRYYGGGCGTVFKFDLASGRETILYRFKGGRDGAKPSRIIDVNGVLYGTTADGGRKDNGTVFSLSP
jgi:uncharacterized repeat protein (TIGR03803 family)